MEIIIKSILLFDNKNNVAFASVFLVTWLPFSSTCMLITEIGICNYLK